MGNIESLDYYLYLLKASWPALCGLLFVYLFFIVRLLGRLKSFFAKTMDSAKVRAVAVRTFLTLTVLCIYTGAFVENYGDWFFRPYSCRGIVEDLQVNTHSQPAAYNLILQNEKKEIIKVKIDENTFRRLHKDDYIELSFLPVKKDVFRCLVLTRQAGDII